MDAKWPVIFGPSDDAVGPLGERAYGRVAREHGYRDWHAGPRAAGEGGTRFFVQPG